MTSTILQTTVKTANNQTSVTGTEKVLRLQVTAKTVTVRVVFILSFAITLM